MQGVAGFSIAAALCLGWTGGAQALTRQQDDAAKAFAINNSVWVLYHEVGHLFVDQFQLPVLGAREEDAADALATLMLLDQDTADAEQILRDTVAGWFETDLVLTSTEYDKADFYDPHALDVVRAYGMACLMVGKEYLKYRPMTAEIGMDSGRVSDCTYDYELAERSWTSTLEPFLGGGKAGATIDIVYDEAPRGLRRYVELIKKERLLESVAEDIAARYALERPVTLRGMSCDDANAFYDADLNEIQFCYEYVQYYYDIKAAELKESGDDGIDAPDTAGAADTPVNADKLDN